VIADVASNLPRLPEPAAPAWLKLPVHWPAQADLIDFCQHMSPGMAALLILLGVIYLLFGFKVFKALVLLNSAAVGAAVGFVIGQKSEMCLPLMVLCGFVAATITWPLMKWAVAVTGGVFGALVGASIWHTFNLDPQFAWAGAMIGLILFGLTSFILFRGSVMMYMSLQGSVMLVFGILGMIFKYQEVAPKVSQMMLLKHFMLPMALFITTVIGMIYQHHRAAVAPAGKK